MLVERRNKEVGGRGEPEEGGSRRPVAGGNTTQLVGMKCCKLLSGDCGCSIKGCNSEHDGLEFVNSYRYIMNVVNGHE